MITVWVNNSHYETEQDKSLLRYLRDDLKLTSVKDGCSEGACGTCHVLIDGKATKACIPKLSKLEGRHIVTIEGFSEFERNVFVQAFGEAGAVQCGFCIPGMVISAKALLDKNPDPSRDEAAFAIRNNICRCTGYKKIIDGILLAAKYLREGELPERVYTWKIGERVPRLDVREKVLGTGRYPDDIYLEGMVHASAVRSAYPRARVLSIDTSEAKALPGVLGVYTAADIPGQNKVGHIFHDWDTMIAEGDITRYVGDAIALVVAETRELAEQAKQLVRIDYEELTPVTSPEEAARPDAPRIHEKGNLLCSKHVYRGDADAAIARSAHVISRHFSTPIEEHAFLEPECAVAIPEADGTYHIYTADQGVFNVREECILMLGCKREKVKLENALVGGGFGGKEDASVQHLALLAAYHTGRPVKCKLSRQESMQFHPKRHPMEMDFTVGCDENGILQGVKVDVVSDTGAYASLGAPVLERACTHAGGPYKLTNFRAEGRAYYTNNPPAGAFRGFGVTQTCFGMETIMNLLAEEVGITPWEIRYRNALRPGDEMCNGQIVDASTGIVETLEAVRDYVDANPGCGIACCMKNAGVGVGLPDWGRVKLEVIDGKVHIRSGASCIGQGLGTVLTMIVAEHAGLTRADIVYDASNTYNAPDSGMSSGSRQTTVTGEACRRASLMLADALKEKSLAQLEGECFLGEYLAETDFMGAPVKNPVSHVAYGYATQVCVLNADNTVKEIVAAHEVGRAINPLSVEGQIEGGVIMGFGFALTEQYVLNRCEPVSKYGTLGLPRADKVPLVTPVIVEKQGLKTSSGAIGIGEITSIPTAPAIGWAYYKRDGKLRDRLPLSDTPYEKKKKDKR